jgi:hypothetical protein
MTPRDGYFFVDNLETKSLVFVLDFIRKWRFRNIANEKWPLSGRPFGDIRVLL